MATDSTSARYTPFIGNDGEYALDAKGAVVMDATVQTEVRCRLTARRGHYIYDPTFGSRFYECKTDEDVRTKAPAIVAEALQPMVDQGRILGAGVSEVVEIWRAGEATHGISIWVQVDDEQILEIAALPIGVAI